MTTNKTPDITDLNALAIEACDMWQEQLASYAKNPAAKAELMNLLEPQRKLFADWAALMQQGAQPAAPSPTPHPTSPISEEELRHDSEQEQPAAPNPCVQSPTFPAEAAPAAASPDGGILGDHTLRLAQLAVRMAELEKRVAQLELIAVGAARRT